MLRKRLNAYIIDYVAIFLITQYFTFSFFKLIDLLFQNQAFMNSVKSHIIYVHQFYEPLLSFTIFISYFTLSYYLGNGKTLGKLLYSLRVKAKENRPLTLFESFSRAVGYILFPINCLMIISRRDQKGFHDLISFTEVTKESSLKLIKTQASGEKNVYKIAA